MKWPNSFSMVRHGQTPYNELQSIKDAHPLYQEFKSAYNARHKDRERALYLASLVMEVPEFKLDYGDRATPLTDLGHHQARQLGVKLQHRIPLPDVVFVSPALRTYQTRDGVILSWPELADVKMVEDDRVREQDHGQRLVYNDWRVYNLLNPVQEELRKREGPYFYRHLQGESVPDMRDRSRSMLGTLTRDYAEQNVLIFTHHLWKLATRANIERLGPDEFMHINEHDRPINCGLTIYQGEPGGQDGHLKLDVYNEKLY